MSEKAKEPVIRFKGFSDTWEEKKLGEVCSEIGDGLHSAPEYDDEGDFFFINGNNLINGQIVIDSDETKRVSEETFKKNDKHLDKNTVLLSINGTIGNLAYYQGERVMLGKSAAYLKVSGIEKSFLYTSLQTPTILNSFLLSLTGTTIKNLGLEAIKNTTTNIPKSLSEQQKIGSYFRQLDRLITLYQQKYNKLTSVKKSMLQKMFPASGQTVPALRFAGFTDKWQVRKLGEVCQITMGQSPDGSTYSEEPSDYILVQGNADLKDGWVSPRIWTTQKTKMAQAGDLIMSVRAPAGAMGKTAYDVVLGRGVAGIKGNEFIYQTLVKYDSEGYWKALAAGSTFESINSDVVNNATILIPQNESEQQKIGSYFRPLDHLIALCQQELQKLQNLKKACLKKMFV